ncbi:MAG: hypothetical protein CXT64_05070 [Methanobacteriota archaeon]|nr:MAG: hypothetical protein CXT64_05070 [Euryarchaeota archaeon]
MEYKILAGAEMPKLAKKVNEAIEQGWRPQGGLVVINDYRGFRLEGYSSRCAQAMVKPDEGYRPDATTD